MKTSLRRQARNALRAAVALAYAAAVAVSGCGSDGQTGDSQGVAEGLRSTANITVHAAVSPASVAPNQEVSVQLSVTSTLAVTTDIVLRVFKPSGIVGYTTSWLGQNLAANTPLVLTKSIAVAPGDRAGTYFVGAEVKRTGSFQVFFDSNRLASFAVTSGGSSAITLGETNSLSGVDSGNGDLLVSQQASLGEAATMQSMSFNVVTAAGSLVLGIYDATGVGGGPGALKAQTASFTPVVGWNTHNLIRPVALSAGTYWLAYRPSSNALAFEADFSTGSYWTAPYTFGAMPASFPTSGVGGTTHWALYASSGGSSACVPTTCAAQGASCGSIGDGCGGTLSCAPARLQRPAAAAESQMCAAARATMSFIP
jgi:hypothetical protein